MFSFKVIGNVTPPSVDNFIVTLAQLIGATSVVPLFQVMVCELPAFQEVLEFCDVTKKASASVTVIATSSLEYAPPVALLSLTKKEKLSSLATEGITSQVVEVLPEITVSNFGKYLSGVSTGNKDLNIGPTALNDSGGIIPISLSICSQL